MTRLEEVMLDEVRQQLARWAVEFDGRPDLEREQLLLLALEREQIVAVAYREEAVAARVAALRIDDDVRALIRQTLVWVWKDEQLHAEYMRGLLLESGGLGSSLIIYGRQLQGTLSGWTAATANHSSTRLRTGAAGVLVAAARVAKRMPPELADELRYQTFHLYCQLNIALEASAEFAYRRLVQLAASDAERTRFERIRDDEERHTAAFRLLTSALTDDDQVVAGLTAPSFAAQLAEISPWFVPAEQRAATAGRQRFGSRAPVVVRSGRDDSDKLRALEECLDRAGLAELAANARTAVIRASFMLGYHQADRSNINDPEIVDGLARYLRRHGVQDVAVLESPTIYGTLFGNRSVTSVARYFGFDSPAYRIVDIGGDLRPHTFDRGFVQQAVSGSWVDADLRIVLPKLRTDPTEFAHLSLSSLEGSTGSIEDTFYAGRQVDFRSATMMLLDIAAPDFALVDAWAPVADGPFGVMACNRPAQVRHLYAGTDALSVDEVVLADLGIADARQAPIVAQAYHWFGFDPAPIAVDGQRPALGAELRGAHASAMLRALGTVSYPVYMYLSKRGELFVPAFDTVAFPPLSKASAPIRGIRWIAQRAFGLRPPG